MATISFKTSKTFTSTAKLTPELIGLIEDKDKNGIPDFIDEAIKNGQSITTTDIEINGKKYHSWDEVPSEFQKFRPLTEPPASSPDLPAKPLPSDPSFFIRDFKLYLIATGIVLTVYFLTRYFKVI